MVANGISNGDGKSVPREIETRLFINNEFVKAQKEGTFEVINPATEEITAHVQEATNADVELAVAAAEAAFPAWSELGGFQRAAYFYKLADLFEQHNDQLALLEAVSMGRPVSTYTEGLASARFLRYMAGKATDIQGESSLQTAGFVNITLRQPYGVCAAITPWNAPVTMMTFKMGPAVIAGNTLIAKSSEKAPLTSLLIAKLVKEAGFPPGVINILNGHGALCGAALSAHPRIRKISFTGSVRAGKAILEAAAKSNLKKVTLELGGKSPLIIFEDADVVSAAEAAAKSILLNSGQACIASSRVYVHESIADTIGKELVRVLKSQGSNPQEGNDPLLPTTRRGPQATEGQFTSILGYFSEAKEAGYEILCGGKQEGRKGFFIEPTVIFKADEQSRVMKEEVFGPVICLSVFTDEKEVLKRANDSEYGLYASVYTHDIKRALRVAKTFEAGNVGVNVTSPMMTHDMPFGGWKQSGIGQELGVYSVREWTELKTIYMAL
ncbi:hypothetical protein LTR10_023069 [Elasticomyces elasticus]|uniref:aldehyde dehydrogenase (NAD(+)) n=1 Tax=Exophiala sideris TaxID=1016849 RepID=A0ABR0IUR2_9EURO|nr:hypothetical protein LTR10_023069 [Elasticomyces elasticus]KAK5021086.1 hypothetical protein LTS07_011239 [Exophiala sideris]KAK5023284.1 hypothetical protein LTR13_011274 [Exophiala sideris]KAK5048807.1 hypothetical protein LTR69_011270 [Exophiala sideris]KAK5176256.1 hypothetical protein LTR44_011187 [Eurotiomycetes sp. CCFEE 6388]